MRVVKGLHLVLVSVDQYLGNFPKVSLTSQLKALRVELADPHSKSANKMLQLGTD